MLTYAIKKSAKTVQCPQTAYTAIYDDICNHKECEDGPMYSDGISDALTEYYNCLLYTSPSPRDLP